MCRIAGLITPKHNLTAIQDMATSMMRGGPDDEGFFYDEAEALAFGHRRLSIIDLTDAGHQPMHNSDESITLIFNGEIYNFLQLKDELSLLGHSFKTKSDTEVIIKAYEEWGEECFSKLKGMFAIAIYDKRRKEVLLARDPMGIKPLYYFVDNEQLIFASEIRALKKLGSFQENPDWKVYFYTYGFLPEPVTTLKGVHPLRRGTCLKYSLNTKSYTNSTFYNPTYTSTITDYKEAKYYVKEKLELAVKRHLISDAPIGFFLSGGIDSSLLTLLGNKYKKEDLHTLSIIFNDKNYSEKQYQELIAEQTDAKHHPFLLEKDMFLNALPDIFEAMDQPSTDGVNTYFICKYAKDAGLKAVISGLGADELLGGYASFKNAGIANKIKAAPGFILRSSKFAPQYKYKKISFLDRRDPIGDYLFNRGYYSTDETARILDADESWVKSRLDEIQVPEFVSSLEDGNKTSYLESDIYMQSQLLKDTDYMSMWHSIEVRVPFLDIDFVDAVNSISASLKFDHEQGKYLLIDSFKDVLPKEIWDRKKQGFVFPFQEWMKSGKGDILEGKKNQRLEQMYQSGKLNWSRYWTYMIANLYKA